MRSGDIATTVLEVDITTASQTSQPAPMPQRIAPMLATAADKAPTDDANWLFEYKWDGVRAISYIDDANSLRIESRNRLDITPRYPELAALAKELADHRVVLDGEIVALDAAARPSFERLQQRMHVNDAGSIRRLVAAVPIFYFIFDVLWLNGFSTMSLPMTKRRQLLEELIDEPGPSWQLSPAEIGGGCDLLESARSLGLEGIVAKRLDSIYEPGRRSAAWRKIKLTQRQEFVIGAWQEQTNEPNLVGALLAGVYDPPGTTAKSGLRFAGRVGSGFSIATHATLLKKLRPLENNTNPFVDPLPKEESRRHFVAPTLVAEVEFRGWTDANVIRHAVFKGLRDDKPAAEVTRQP